MRKIFSVLLAALLLFGGVCALAEGDIIPSEDPGSPEGSGSAEITSEVLRGNETAATVYYFTLNWTAKNALYQKSPAYTWSTEQLCYIAGEADWVCVDNSAGVTMTVENRSNAPILLQVKEITVPESAASLLDESSISGGSGSVRIASAAGEFGEQGTAQEGSLSVTLNTLHQNGDILAGTAFSEGNIALATITFLIDAVSEE